MLPNLDRAQQRGCSVLSALVLSYVFISHSAGLRQIPPLSPVVGTESRPIVIELEGAVQKPGLFTYQQPPTVSRVIRDGGGVIGKSEIAAQRGQEVLTKDRRMVISVDNARRLNIESGPCRSGPCGFSADPFRSIRLRPKISTVSRASVPAWPSGSWPTGKNTDRFRTWKV